MKSVSVIIPVFNQEQYLADAIDSVLSQSVKPLEIIVVDDGSTDNSLNIAKSYGKKIKVIHQVNKGLSSARNTGIAFSRGSYVLPLDSDDLLLENALSRILEALEATPVDIVSPSFKCFGKINNEVILMKNPTLNDFKEANRVGYCSLIKRSALLEIGGYSPRMTWGWEDWHLWIDLLSRGKTLITISEPLWLYRTKEVSMITEANKHSEELMAQLHKDFPKLYE